MNHQELQIQMKAVEIYKKFKLYTQNAELDGYPRSKVPNRTPVEVGSHTPDEKCPIYALKVSKDS